VGDEEKIETQDKPPEDPVIDSLNSAIEAIGEAAKWRTQKDSGLCDRFIQRAKLCLTDAKKGLK